MKKTVESILEELLPGIRGQAHKRALNKFQAEDFTQEAIIAVIIASKGRIRKMRYGELILFLGTVAKNRIIDCQRHSITHLNKESELHEWHGTVEHSSIIEVQDLLDKILAAISPEARLILLEKLEPGSKTDRLMAKERGKRKADAARGYLSSQKVRLSNKILSESLNLNKKQIREAIKEIQDIATKLLSTSDDD